MRGSPREAEPGVHTGPDQSELTQEGTAKLGSAIFPLSQETSQMTCYCSLSPYWGVLGLARPDQRAENRCSSGWQGESGMGTRSKYKQLLRIRSHRRTEVEPGLIWCFPSPTETLPARSWARENRGNEMHAVRLALSGSTVLGGWSSVSPLSPHIHCREPCKVRRFGGATISVTSVALRMVAPAAPAPCGEGVNRVR